MSEHPGFTIWFTGLSGAGKTTVSELVAPALREKGLKVEVLDGDVVRTNLSKGLGFSKEDRDTNIRRIAFVADLLSRNGVGVITAAISPYREIRREARETMGERFIEVYVKASVEACAERDVKGLYEKAFKGEIKEFTGVSDPYDVPEHAEIVLDTENESPEESAQRVIAYVEEKLGRGRVSSLTLSHKQTADFELLGNGGFAPLQGFQGSEAWESVVDSMRLPDGQPWPIPVTLASETGEVGDTIELIGHEGSKLGTITVEEVYERDLAREAENVFRTTDEAHPGVAMTYREGSRTIAGPISVEKLPEHIDAVKPYLLTPEQTKKTFEERGWKTVVAFQTRNPIHRAHEYITKSALEIVDGLFIHPIVGETKSDDIPPETRMKCYEVLIENYYVPERVVLGVNPAAMRYAGPREAIFHALVRRNYGCTHFIVGRDHAGVGDYYGTYDAQHIFDEFEPGELGIEPLKYEHSFFCKLTKTMATAKTSPASNEDKVFLSGTAVREMLGRGERPPEEFSRPEVADVLIGAYAEQSEPAPA